MMEPITAREVRQYRELTGVGMREAMGELRKQHMTEALMAVASDKYTTKESVKVLTQVVYELIREVYGYH